MILSIVIWLNLCSTAQLYSRTIYMYIFVFCVDRVKRNSNIFCTGIRMHTTNFEREKDAFPLPFAIKLRKHIKNRRCTAVRQLGLDRVVDLTFGVGDKAHHLIFEFYAAGNMILTDHQFNILDLLRVHTYENNTKETKDKTQQLKKQEKKKKKKNRRKKRSNSSSSIQSNRVTNTEDDDDTTIVRVGRVYPLALAARNVTDILSSLKGSSSSSSSSSKEEEEEEEEEVISTTNITNLNAKRLQVALINCFKESTVSDEVKKDTKIGLKWFLTSRLDCTKMFGPNLISHCIVSAELSLRTSLQLDDGESSTLKGLSISEQERLCDRLRTLPSLLVQTVRDVESKGFILLRKKRKDEDENTKRYEEYVMQIYISTTTMNSKLTYSLASRYTPRLFAHHTNREIMRFESLNHAMDEFFSRVEVQRSNQKKKSQIKESVGRVEKVRRQVQTRIESLAKQRDTNTKRAQAIEMNASFVNEAIKSINDALASGIDWTALQEILNTQRRMRHPVATALKSLHLDDNEISLSLRYVQDDDNDDDDTEEEMFTVRINLSLSAHANAQQYYAKRRANQTKYESAVATAEKAVSAAKMKHEKMLQSKQKTVSRIKIQRKRYWFEKFDWFISPEGYLVIAGRNAQQNETLVKRYLRHGIDVFVRVICISFSFPFVFFLF